MRDLRHYKTQERKIENRTLRYNTRLVLSQQGDMLSRTEKINQVYLMKKKSANAKQNIRAMPIVSHSESRRTRTVYTFA